MRVTGYQTWLVRVPYEEGRVATHLVLQLEADDGSRGVAYVTPLMPWVPKPLRAAVEWYAEQTVGQDPLAVESVTGARLARAVRPQFEGLARSAAGLVDIALWDLKAQALGQPLWRLLGGAQPNAPVYASWNLWWQYDIDTLVEHAREHVARGFRAMKVRLGGVATIEEAVERCRAVREAVGEDIAIHVDMNWAWDVNKTIAFGRALGSLRLAWIEDPIPAHDIEGMREIAAALETPICTGETYDRPSQFRELLERRGADIVMIDLEVGGITAWMQSAHVVQSFDVPIASHMCTEISAHLIAVIGGYTTEYIPWAEPIFTGGPTLEDGRLVLSERPGLGLELDAGGLERFAVAEV